MFFDFGAREMCIVWNLLFNYTHWKIFPQISVKIFCGELVKLEFVCKILSAHGWLCGMKLDPFFNNALEKLRESDNFRLKYVIFFNFFQNKSIF